jgi:hypothetical protein
MNEPRPELGQLPVQMDLPKSLRRTKTLTRVALGFAAAMPVTFLLVPDPIIRWFVTLPVWLASFVVSFVALVVGIRGMKHARADSPSPRERIELSSLTNWALAAIGVMTVGLLAVVITLMFS